MKEITNILAIAFLLTLVQSVNAQKKVTETTLKVDGVCFMCKERIESALDTAGVKYAEWDIDTKILKIAFRNDKYTVTNISQILANAGHDTAEVKATSEAYGNLNMCCLYRDEEVVDAHKDH